MDRTPDCGSGNPGSIPGGGRALDIFGFYFFVNEGGNSGNNLLQFGEVITSRHYANEIWFVGVVNDSAIMELVIDERTIGVDESMLAEFVRNSGRGRASHNAKVESGRREKFESLLGVISREICGAIQSAENSRIKLGRHITLADGDVSRETKLFENGENGVWSVLV